MGFRWPAIMDDSAKLDLILEILLKFDREFFETPIVDNEEIPLVDEDDVFLGMLSRKKNEHNS